MSAAQVNPQFVAQVQKIRSALDGLDYFQLLRIPYEAGAAEVRAGYHQQARTFHPDRYAYLGLPQLVDDLTAITKRIAEAYVVLRDPTKREAYRQGVQGPERALRLRFVERHEEEQRAQQKARTGTTRQGRQLFEQAMAAYGRNDRAAAISSLKMAMLYEKDNEAFRVTLADWERGDEEADE